MARATFDVTADIVKPSDGSDAPIELCGFIEKGCPLRDAVRALYKTRTGRVNGVVCVETDSSPCDRPRWVTVQNGMELLTGEYETRYLHIAPLVSRASARRIARLCGVSPRHLTSQEHKS